MILHAGAEVRRLPYVEQDSNEEDSDECNDGLKSLDCEVAWKADPRASSITKVTREPEVVNMEDNIEVTSGVLGDVANAAGIVSATEVDMIAIVANLCFSKIFHLSIP